jgi:DNA repair exonuclease SbcCD ATPase subunit
MNRMSELALSVKRTRSRLDQQAGEARALGARGKAVNAELAQLKLDIEKYEQISGVLNKLGDERQEDAQRRIEGLVTRGLQTIFGEELSFHLVSSVKGKTVQTDFMVRSTLEDGSQIDTPVLEARGGGLAVVVGFLLRLVVKLLSAPTESHVMHLDESFAQLSAEYEPRLAEFLREIVDKTNVQIILITHSNAFNDQADKVYRFRLVNGETKVVVE